MIALIYMAGKPPLWVAFVFHGILIISLLTCAKHPKDIKIFFVLIPIKLPFRLLSLMQGYSPQAISFIQHPFG